MSAVDPRLEEEALGAFDALGCFTRLMRIAHPHRWLLGLCVIGSLLSSALQVAMPLLVRVGVDRYMTASSSGEIDLSARVDAVHALAALYGVLLLANLGVAYLVGLGLNHLGQQVVMAIRRTVWAHLHRLPIRYFDLHPVGRLVTRVANDTSAVAEMFTSVLASGVGDVMMLLGVATVMLGLDAGLSAVVLAIFLPLGALTHWFKTTSRRLQRRMREQSARLSAFFQENIQGIAVVKSFTAESRMLERFHHLNLDAYATEVENVRVFAIFRPLVSACSTLGVALVLWWGGAWALEGRLSPGTLVALLLYVRMLFGPVDTLAEKFNILQQALVASERILRILDTPDEGAAPERVALRASDRAPQTPRRAEGRVCFDNVSFAYHPDKPVLSQVSFEIAPGETVALVGPSGSGKTTIAQLLLAFYPLGENGDGRILLDGIPIEAWEPRVLRQQLALVQQDLFLFATTLRRNITLFSSPESSRFAQALEISQATRVAERFAEGLEHRLNERATMLSQGERQLISFARALVVDPPVLILDEATASIDSHTEVLIQKALHRALEGRSALVVAHRLSTVQEADRILVLNQGRIVEQGSHADLLAADGLYAHMFRTQQLDPR